MSLFLYQLSLVLFVVSVTAVFACVVARNWSMERRWPRLTGVSVLGVVTALGLTLVVRGRVDTTVDQEALQRLQAALTTRPLLALQLVALGLLAGWVYRRQRWSFELTIVDGQVLDAGPQLVPVRRDPAAGQRSTRLTVFVSFADGILRPQRYTQVIPVRWEEATDAPADLGVARLTMAEQRTIRDELIHRNPRAWRQRASQVRTLLDESGWHQRVQGRHARPDHRGGR